MLIVIAFFNIISCNTNKVVVSDQVTITSFTLQEIKAINLTEDTNKLSTNNDEIFLSVHCFDESDQLIIDNTFYKTFVFDSINNAFVLNENFLIKSNKNRVETFVITLIELDSEVLGKTLVELLNNQLSIAQLNKPNADKERIEKLLDQDDVLDIKMAKVKRFEQGVMKNIVFKGIQMFNKYEYHLLLKID